MRVGRENQRQHPHLLSHCSGSAGCKTTKATSVGLSPPFGGLVRRLVGAIRAHWPKVEILLRADGHYAAPEVFDWCRADRVDWLFGLVPNAALCRHVVALENSTAERFKLAPSRGKRRRFMQFYDAAGSWSRVERIIARLEAGPAGTDIRFIVTNLEGGRAKHVYERLYCARGQAENHIKAWNNHLAPTGQARGLKAHDRTSCHAAEANQFRLLFLGRALAKPRRSPGLVNVMSELDQHRLHDHRRAALPFESNAH